PRRWPSPRTITRKASPPSSTSARSSSTAREPDRRGRFLLLRSRPRREPVGDATLGLGALLRCQHRLLRFAAAGLVLDRPLVALDVPAARPARGPTRVGEPQPRISLDRIRRRHFPLGMHAAQAVHGQGIARLRRLQVVRRGPVWISRHVAALGVHGAEPAPAALAGMSTSSNRTMSMSWSPGVELIPGIRFSTRESSELSDSAVEPGVAVANSTLLVPCWGTPSASFGTVGPPGRSVAS